MDTLHGHAGAVTALAAIDDARTTLLSGSEVCAHSVQAVPTLRLTPSVPNYTCDGHAGWLCARVGSADAARCPGRAVWRLHYRRGGGSGSREPAVHSCRGQGTYAGGCFAFDGDLTVCTN